MRAVRSKGMLLFGDSLGQTLALIATFGGVGVLVNLLVLYIIGQVMAERKENQEYPQQRG